MAVTPNYSWPVPVATDFVKDGWEAISDLGNAIDTTVAGLGSAGLVLVKSQTIGTAVSSVTVTDAFSATYFNYKIILGGGASSAASANIEMILGATSANYYWGSLFRTYAGTTSANSNANGSNWGNVGHGTPSGLTMSAEIYNPFLTERSTFVSSYAQIRTDGLHITIGGLLNNATSYTDFTLSASTGTFTGGEIRVYGYEK
jgi:hypothetical protein